MTRRLLDPSEDFSALFDTVTRNSWRWECQGHYAVDNAELSAWLAGDAHPDTDDDRAWFAYVAGLRERGVPFQRVRMLTEPLTDYLRWMLATTDRNIEAGEDIRWITESQARALGMPDYDFYIFDDERLLIFRFDAAKVQLGEEMITDEPDMINQHRRWRDLVWQHAIRHQDYISAR